MKFRDLLLPKIVHSNPEKRMEAVATEKNAELLKKVIENDADPRVVEAAQKRLKALGEPVA